MKIKKDFELREIAGSYVVFPVGEQAMDFNGMITLNETGAFLWQKLLDGATKESLCDALCTEYDIDSATAMADIDAYVAKLTEIGCLDVD